MNPEDWKFNKLKEHLELAKKTNDKELEKYLREIMTKKYIEHQKKKLRNVNQKKESSKSSKEGLYRNNQLTPLPLTSVNPAVIPYSNKKDKQSNNLVAQINMRQRLDSNFAIMESIRNNNKTEFIKPYA